MIDRDWQTQAVCRGRLDSFFPGRGQPYTAAKRLCRQCPVKDDCLEAAMDEEGDTPAALRHGMRGGLTPHQRWQLHRCRIGKCSHDHHKGRIMIDAG